MMRIRTSTYIYGALKKRLTLFRSAVGTRSRFHKQLLCTCSCTTPYSYSTMYADTMHLESSGYSTLESTRKLAPAATVSASRFGRRILYIRPLKPPGLKSKSLVGKFESSFTDSLEHADHKGYVSRSSMEKMLPSVPSSPYCVYSIQFQSSVQRYTYRYPIWNVTILVPKIGNSLLIFTNLSQLKYSKIYAWRKNLLTHYPMFIKSTCITTGTTPYMVFVPLSIMASVAAPSLKI